MGESEDVLDLLEGVRRGVAAAEGALFERLQLELRQIAGAVFGRQRGAHTLQPTALLSEAWIRMVGAGRPYNDRQHFLAVAARAMRQVLVSHERQRTADKRGGGRRRERLTVVEPTTGEVAGDVDVLALDSALERLRALSPRQAQIAELRYFAGLTVREIAELLAVTTRTIELDWKMARAQLSLWLEGDPGPSA